MLPTEKTAKKTSLADLTVLVYGQTKIGKSTWCSSAEGALFLATEPGLNHLEVFQIPIASWEQLLAAGKEIAEGKHAFKTVVIDTIDNAFRMCAEFVCAKNKIEHESDLGYGKGYALISNEFFRVLNKLALLPYGLFLISHSTEKEFDTRTGKITRIVPTLPDKARKIVLGMADMVLFCDVEPITGPDGKPSVRRVVRTKPSPHYEAGDRTGRLPDVMDLDFKKFTDAFASATASERPEASANRPTSTAPTPTPSKAGPASVKERAATN
jgi:AAA domain-containing protein